MSSRSQSLSRLPRSRTVASLVASSLVMALAVVLPGGTARAAVTPLIAQAFTGSTVPNEWYLPPAASGTNSTCLTAGASTSQTPIPGCGGTADAAGSGTLRITAAVGNAVGSAFYNTTLPTSQGLDIKYDTFQYNGNGSSGADGIGFALTAVDPANPAPPTVTGPLGGSLGYSATSSTSGIPYGFLGYGLDVYGNYANSAFGGTGCSAPAGLTNGTAYPEAMTVRGAGNGLAGYCILGSTAQTYRVTSGGGSANETLSNLGGQYLDRYNITTRPTPVSAEIAMNPNGVAATTASGISVPANSYLIKVTPYASASGGTGTGITQTGPLPTTLNSTVLAGFPASWINPTTHLPYQVSFGWVASTGGAQEVHEISNMTATTLNGQLPVLNIASSDNESGKFLSGNQANVVLTPSVSATGGPESNTMTVTDTLPAGLTPGTATAPSAWTCATAGQKVTCTYTPASAVAAGTTLPAITIPVTVSSSAAASLSNTARVGSTDGAPDVATVSYAVSTFGASRSAASIAFGATDTLGTTGLPANATGTVTYTSGGSTLCSFTLPATSCTTPTTLVPGSYTVTATYSGDTAYASATATTSFTVTKAATAITASAAPASAPYGTAVTLTAGNVPAAATGTITFKNGATLLCSATLPATSCPTATTLALGSYTVSVAYPGDGNYTASSASTTFSVVAAATSFTAAATPPSISYGDTTTLSATGLPAGATGTVTFKSGSTTWCTATLPLTSCVTPATAPVGTHAVTATYSGDAHYLTSTATTSFSVSALSTAVSVSVAPGTTTYGAPVTLTESGLPAGATGTVTFTSGGTTLCTVAVASATSCTSPTGLVPGSYPVTGTYSGDPVYASSTDTTSFTVTKAPTGVTASATPTSVSFGNAVVLGAGGLPGGATGTVTFVSGGVTLCSFDVATASSCSTPANVAVGAHPVTATYSGDARWTGSTASTSFTVTSASTTLTVSASPGSVAYGSAVTLTSGGLPAAATGTVTFTSGATTLCTLTVPTASSCSTSATLAPASYPVTGTYSGDASYASSTATTSFVVTRAPSAVVGSAPTSSPYGAPITLTAGNLPAGATGTVTMSEGGTTACTVTLPALSCVATGNPVLGSHSLTATYSGDPHYTGSSDAFSFAVVKADTAVTATATPASVQFGDTVTLTPASLPADATGTVTFTSGGTTLCTVTLGAQTSCLTPAEPVGTYPVDATYSGDSSYNGSAGGTSFEVGAAATVFAVSADPAADEYGTAVSLTPAGLPADATGTITLTSGGTTLCVVHLPAETSCQTSATLAVGTYPVTASYSGDGSYAPSTAATSFTVGAALTTMSAAAAPTAAPYRTPVALSFSGLPVDATGAVLFTSGGTTLCTAALPATSCSSSTTLAPGTYPVVASYSGDVHYQPTTAATTFDVVRAAVPLSASATPPNGAYGSPFTLTGAGVPAGATGSLTFSTGGTTLCMVTLPTSSCAVPGNLAPGGHTITVTYPGDGHYLPATDTTTVTITAGITAITASATPGSAAYGTSATLAAGGLPAGASGTVTFTSGAMPLCTATLPAISCGTSPSLAPGSYPVTATYSGDGNWSGSTATTAFSIVSASVTMTATATPASVPYGTAVLLQPGGLPAGATGTVVFSTGSTTLCTVHLGTDTGCSTAADLAAGSYPVDAVYSGDSNFASGSATTSFTVTKATPPLSASSTPASAAYGDPVALAVSALPAGATGTVTFSSGGTVWCTVTLPANGCAVPLPLAPGSWTVDVAYSGDGNYVAASTTTAFTVTKATVTMTASPSPATTTYGVADTLSVAGLPADATGTVTFTSGGTVLCTVTLGSATSCGTPVSLGAGDHPVVASYSGDDDYAGTTAATSFTVSKAAPAVTAAAAPPAVAHGSTVTLSLSGLPSAATGTVVFTAGGHTLCTATVDAHTACTTSGELDSGDYAVVATYSGDDNFVGQVAHTGFTVGPVAATMTSQAPAGAAQSVVVPVPAGDTIALVDDAGNLVDTVTVPGQGTYVLDPATGTITFTPAAGFAGAASGVRYRLTDAAGTSSTGSYLPVVAMPAAPVAHHATSTGRAGTVQHVTLQVPSGDSVILVDAQGREVRTVTVAGQGRYVLDPSTHRVSFTPVAGYVGRPKPVKFRVSDPYGQHAAEFYAPVVTAVPTANPTPASTPTGTPTSRPTALPTSPTDGGLPFTGFAVAQLLTATGLLLAAGTVLLLLSRRRRA